MPSTVVISGAGQVLLAQGTDLQNPLYGRLVTFQGTGWVGTIIPCVNIAPVTDPPILSAVPYTDRRSGQAVVGGVPVSGNAVIQISPDIQDLWLNVTAYSAGSMLVGVGAGPVFQLIDALQIGANQVRTTQGGTGLDLSNQPINTIFAAPDAGSTNPQSTTGAFTARALTTNDLPDIYAIVIAQLLDYITNPMTTVQLPTNITAQYPTQYSGRDEALFALKGALLN